MRHLAALLLLTLAACATPAPSMIFLVRHAEKAPDPGDGDPVLSEVGHARAEALARALSDEGIEWVFVTDTKRTHQTATPLMKARGLEPVELPREDTEALAAKIRALSPWSRALVVNHSDTLPKVLAALGLPAPIIEGGDYDDLFVVVQVGDDRHLHRLHYGAGSL